MTPGDLAKSCTNAPKTKQNSKPNESIDVAKVSSRQALTFFLGKQSSFGVFALQ